MLKHNTYPHTPGMLYDCEMCESTCFCGPEGDEPCVHCALSQESEDLATHYDQAAWYDLDS
jgi:hypothetical protein